MSYLHDKASAECPLMREAMSSEADAFTPDAEGRRTNNQFLSAAVHSAQ